MPSTVVHLPEMALTLVRRVTARLPYNHFLFRAEPSVTKHEVREYLEKVYGVRVARVATSISLGASLKVKVVRCRTRVCNLRAPRNDKVPVRFSFVVNRGNVAVSASHPRRPRVREQARCGVSPASDRCTS